MKMKFDLLKNINIHTSSEFETQLVKYTELFLSFNEHTNLISKNDAKVLFEKHIFDSLAIGLLDKINSCKTLLDIGTGGGFPACPIAIAFPQIEVLGVDSIAKKIKFINELAAEMQLKNLTAIASRTEHLPKNYLEYFDIVTSRAVAPLNIILEYAAPYIRTGGYFIAYKSKLADEEIKDAQNALKILNCKIEEIIDYQLPLEDSPERKLIIIKKEKPTPAGFPRREGLAKSNPL